MVYACTICTKTPKHVVYEGYVRVKTGIVIALDPSYTFSPVLIWIRGFIRISFLVLISRHSVPYNTYLLLTEFEVRTVSYGPSFFPVDLWPKREARGP